MNEVNDKMNGLFRSMRRQELTAVASDQHRGANAQLRAMVRNQSVTVGGEKRQEAPQDATAPTDTATGAVAQPEQPKAPTGNAGNGAYVATSKPRPTMNDLFRSAWRGKPTNIVNRYEFTGREIR